MAVIKKYLHLCNAKIETCYNYKQILNHRSALVIERFAAHVMQKNKLYNYFNEIQAPQEIAGFFVISERNFPQRNIINF